MSDLHQRLSDVRSRIDEACDESGREPADIRLIAVSKGHDVDAIRSLYDEGVRDFGESYVQEWQEKAPALPDDISWHFIGHLQSNKARFVADDVAWVHSVDRKSVMKELNKRSSDTCNVLLQINVAEDPNKSGADPDAVLQVLQKAANYERLEIGGLMTIPPYTDDPELARPHFRELRRQFERCREWLADEAPERLEDFVHLSMGMTADFDIAIEEGATMIRVGTALFGPRNQ